ncbi:MAG: RNA polymerase sigma factor [Acidobacteriota bacterium]
MGGSFDEVFERYQRRIFTLAVYTLANREEAEEVTQDVLVKVWRRGGEVPADGRLAWALRVTRNACIDRIRRRAAARSVALDAGGLPEILAAAGPGPEERARNRVLRRRLVSALGELEEPYRSALILREVQGLSYREVADTLELPLNTVRVHIHRGRRKLRDELREVYADVAS